MHPTVILVCIGAFATAVGFVVKKVLDYHAELRMRVAADEILAKVSGSAVGDTPAFLGGMTRGKRAQMIRSELPDALDMISNSLTAGLTLPQAMLRNLDHMSPVVQSEFARVIYDTRLGFSVADAFDNFSRRMAIRDVRLIAIASRIGVEHGGNLAQNYRMLSKLLRDNLAFESELRAMTTEGRMQAIVMSCLPFALMAILSLVCRELMIPLFTTVQGWLTIAGLCLMLLVAYCWISRIVRIEV